MRLCNGACTARLLDCAKISVSDYGIKHSRVSSPLSLFSFATETLRNLLGPVIHVYIRSIITVNLTKKKNRLLSGTVAHV